MALKDDKNNLEKCYHLSEEPADNLVWNKNRLNNDIAKDKWFLNKTVFLWWWEMSFVET